jgi:hypothetical protein
MPVLQKYPSAHQQEFGNAVMTKSRVTTTGMAQVETAGQGVMESQRWKKDNT